jgi:hypothetical protein
MKVGQAGGDAARLPGGLGFVRRAVGAGGRQCGVLPGLGFVRHSRSGRFVEVLQRILRRARLAFEGLRPAGLGAIAATRFGAGTSDGDGRAGRGACTGHGGIPLLGGVEGEGSTLDAPQDPPV